MSKHGDVVVVGSPTKENATGVDGSTLHYVDRHGRPVRPDNLTGVRVGRLVVSRYLRKDDRGKPVWHCSCDCGSADVEASHAGLIGRWKTSCGCRRAETKEAWKTVNYRHGAKSGGRIASEYPVWQSMKDRCLNPNNQDFAYYGGRGITVCDRWRQSFEAFLEDVGPRPSKRHWIDRLDTNGNYDPGNCAWRTIQEQQRNRRSNRRVEWRGESLLLCEWSQKLGVAYDTLRHRLDAGWSVEDAFGKPVKPGFPQGRRKHGAYGTTFHPDNAGGSDVGGIR